MKSRIFELLSTSEDRVEHSQKAFNAARITLTNARTYGTEIHAAAALQAFRDAAEVYATSLRTHANIVTDFAAEA